MSNSVWPHGLQPARFLNPWDSPGKNTGMGFIHTHTHTHTHTYIYVIITRGVGWGRGGRLKTVWYKYNYGWFVLLYSRNHDNIVEQFSSNLKKYIFLNAIIIYSGLPWWLSSKESACQCRRPGFDPWVGKIPWRREWQPTPVFLPAKSQGQRSLGATVHGVAKSQKQLRD